VSGAAELGVAAVQPRREGADSAVFEKHRHGAVLKEIVHGNTLGDKKRMGAILRLPIGLRIGALWGRGDVRACRPMG